MVSPSLRYGVVALVAAIVILALRFTRGFFWSHSVIVGLAAAALVFSTWRTLERWRR
ncbi:MAG: hypothetical protein OES47_06480 [Acidobacteriota bacterium]|nr:hypothetical protein [Acidobacteriota bacterium]